MNILGETPVFVEWRENGKRCARVFRAADAFGAKSFFKAMWDIYEVDPLLIEEAEKVLR